MYEEYWYNAAAPTESSTSTLSQTKTRGERLQSTPDISATKRISWKNLAHIANKTLSSTEKQSPQSPPPITSPSPPKAEVLTRSRSWNDLNQLRKQLDKSSAGGFEISEVQKISDEREFFSWYENFEDELQQANDFEYQMLQATLSSHLYSCDVVLSETKNTIQLLDDLARGFGDVRDQTAAFQNASEGLLNEQARLQSLSENLAVNLEPFNALEGITRRLNAPGADLVTRDDFKSMLSKLDTCLEYMKKHPKFKDAESYQSRYRQCLTRALTLIKVYISNELRDVTADVTKRMGNKGVNETTQSALLYAKFRVGAPTLRDLTDEIEKRCGHEEYLAILDECFGQYAAIRQKLLYPIVSKKLTELATNDDLIAFARSSISYVRSICLDEYDLFCSYFSSGENQVYEFLETICEPLYDHLRPRIIRETQLVKLCELCSLLQTRYMRDPDDPDNDVYERSQLDFGQLIQSPLQDAQTRVIFRSQAAIRDEIENYIPKPEDLDYPKNTETKSLEVLSPTEQDGKSFDTDAVFKGWYPTLRKSISLLSRIYRLVNSSVFDDIAHQVVHICMGSLVKAADLLKTKKTAMDSQLFLIKHLLILKEQIVAFDIEFVRPEVDFDFSAVTGTFWEIREKGSLFNPNALFKLMQKGVPKVVENMLDAKVELDGQLRKMINDFTSLWASKVAGPIVESSGQGPEAGKAVSEMKELIGKEVPQLRRMLADYIDDHRAIESLVGAVQEMVIQSYEGFHERAGDNAFVEEEIIDVDAFIEWSNLAFGRPNEDDDPSDDSRSQDSVDSRVSD